MNYLTINCREESENIRRENLLFSRYLTRINTTKIVDTYDKYEDENKLILEIIDQIKSFDNTRRYSCKDKKNEAIYKMKIKTGMDLVHNRVILSLSMLLFFR